MDQLTVYRYYTFYMQQFHCLLLKQQYNYQSKILTLKYLYYLAYTPYLFWLILVSSVLATGPRLSILIERGSEGTSG